LSLCSTFIKKANCNQLLQTLSLSLFGYLKADFGFARLILFIIVFVIWVLRILSECADSKIIIHPMFVKKLVEKAAKKVSTGWSSLFFGLSDLFSLIYVIWVHCEIKNIYMNISVVTDAKYFTFFYFERCFCWFLSFLFQAFGVHCFCLFIGVASTLVLY
jgi:hypothetical protein